MNISSTVSPQTIISGGGQGSPDPIYATPQPGSNLVKGTVLYNHFMPFEYGSSDSEWGDSDKSNGNNPNELFNSFALPLEDGGYIFGGHIKHRCVRNCGDANHGYSLLNIKIGSDGVYTYTKFDIVPLLDYYLSYGYFTYRRSEVDNKARLWRQDEDNYYYFMYSGYAGRRGDVSAGMVTIISKSDGSVSKQPAPGANNSGRISGYLTFEEVHGALYNTTLELDNLQPLGGYVYRMGYYNHIEYEGNKDLTMPVYWKEPVV